MTSLPNSQFPPGGATPRMDFSRIEGHVDVRALSGKVVTLVGTGGSAGLARNLVRCGVRRLRLIDPDVVGAENLCRQEYAADQVGLPKVDALAAELLRIDPTLDVRRFARDFCSFSDEEIDRRLGDTDVFVLATDRHAPQARGNEACLRLGAAGVWIGLYAGARAGEVAFWHPGCRSCYRCLCESRYRAHEEAGREGRSLDPPSAGADVLAVSYLDALAGMVVLGLLSGGPTGRYGKFVADLGDRNFIQVKIDPDWTFGGRDVIRDCLGIPEGRDSYTGFCAAARRDPEPNPCPDCRRWRPAPAPSPA